MVVAEWSVIVPASRAAVRAARRLAVDGEDDMEGLRKTRVGREFHSVLYSEGQHCADSREAVFDDDCRCTNLTHTSSGRTAGC